jgi:hypothetical protein
MFLKHGCQPMGLAHRVRKRQRNYAGDKKRVRVAMVRGIVTTAQGNATRKEGYSWAIRKEEKLSTAPEMCTHTHENAGHGRWRHLCDQEDVSDQEIRKGFYGPRNVHTLESEELTCHRDPEHQILLQAPCIHMCRYVLSSCTLLQVPQSAALEHLSTS